MASFFQKALGVFVEFDEDTTTGNSKYVTPTKQNPVVLDSVPSASQNQGEAQKFEKYFDGLFERANFPGPDYYEFFKMMETLEVHIHDEKARLSATFAALSIQGLTKDFLIDSANKYKTIIEKDNVDFAKALNEKTAVEVVQRQKELQEIEKKIVSNSEQIQRLTKEITEFQGVLGKLKAKIAEEDNKLKINHNGYQLASKAVISKIETDIQKIQSTL